MLVLLFCYLLFARVVLAKLFVSITKIGEGIFCYLCCRCYCCYLIASRIPPGREKGIDGSRVRRVDGSIGRWVDGPKGGLLSVAPGGLLGEPRRVIGGPGEVPGELQGGPWGTPGGSLGRPSAVLGAIGANSRRKSGEGQSVPRF